MYPVGFTSLSLSFFSFFLSLLFFLNPSFCHVFFFFFFFLFSFSFCTREIRQPLPTDDNAALGFTPDFRAMFFGRMGVVSRSRTEQHVDLGR